MNRRGFLAAMLAAPLAPLAKFAPAAPSIGWVSCHDYEVVEGFRFIENCHVDDALGYYTFWERA